MLIALVIITILTIGVALLFYREVIECLAFSIFGLIFVLYIFGLAGFLLLGLYAIYAITSICFLYILHTLFNHKERLSEILSYKLLFFWGIIVFLIIMLENTRIICYDEFTAWGLFAKSMYYTDKLYIYHEYPVLAKHYQSATAIFQYFTTKTNGVFSETVLLMSMNAIFFSMGFVLLRSLKLKNILEIIIRVFLIFLIPLSLYMWPSLYYTILVDFILGITFGYIIYYYFTNKLNPFTFLNLALALFFLTCSKGNGLVLALLCIGIIYFDLFTYKRQQFQNFVLTKKKSTLLSRINYKNLIISLSPILICIFTYFSWQIALQKLNITSYDTETLYKEAFLGPDFRSNIKLYLGVLQGMLEEYRYFHLSMLVLGYSLLLVNRAKINKKFIIKSIILSSVYVACLCLYIFFLFIVCNTIPTAFLATEALQRYVFTVFAANIFLITFLYIYWMPKKFTLGLTCILLLIIWFTTPAERQFQEFITKYYTSGYTDFRMGYDAILNITDTVHWENDIVYFVSEDEIDIYLSNFNTFPLTLSWRFPYWEDDLSYNEYLEFLSSKPNVNLYPIYTEQEQRYVTNKQKGEMYVYVLKATDDFRLRHQIFFEEEILEETLYKINISEEKITFQQVL